MTTLELHDIQAIQAGRALSDPVDLRLLPGSALGVVGPNGVGKSSLLGAIAQTGIAHSGNVTLGDESLTHMRASRRAKLVSFLAQDLRAPAELRVSELVEIGARASHQTNPAASRTRALETLDIETLADRRYGSLSGGQKQLTQIARVLAQDTPIVIFDEPTAALDLFHQRTIEQQIRRLANDGKIVIAALHDLSLALNVCTQVMLLDRDGGSFTGPPGDVLGPGRVHAAYGVHTSIHTTPQGRSYLATEDQ
ncbi:MAG: ABC transporter ATP-binding protein [Canibacter sp.]